VLNIDPEIARPGDQNVVPQPRKLLPSAEGRLLTGDTWALDDWCSGKTVGWGEGKRPCGEVSRQVRTAPAAAAAAASCSTTDHPQAAPRLWRDMTSRSRRAAVRQGTDERGAEGEKVKRGSETRLAGVPLLRRQPTPASVAISERCT